MKLYQTFDYAIRFFRKFLEVTNIKSVLMRHELDDLCLYKLPITGETDDLL